MGPGFMQTAIVLTGIILIAITGHAIDMAVPTAGHWLVPWKGRG